MWSKEWMAYGVLRVFIIHSSKLSPFSGPLPSSQNSVMKLSQKNLQWVTFGSPKIFFPINGRVSSSMWVILPTAQHPSEWNISTIKSLRLLKHKVPKHQFSYVQYMLIYSNIHSSKHCKSPFLIGHARLITKNARWSYWTEKGEKSIIHSAHILRSKTIKQVKKVNWVF